MKTTLIAIGVLASMAFAQHKCEATIKDGRLRHKYDLSKLYHPDGEFDNFYVSTPGGVIYYMNLCGHSYFSTNGNCAQGSSVCGQSADFTSYGLLSTQDIRECLLSEVGKDGGVSVSYTGADLCDVGEKYKSTVHVVCSESAVPGYIYRVDDNTCDVVFYIYSAYGCPETTKEAAVSAAGIILIVFFILVFLYFVLGAIYQYQFKDPQSPAEYVIHHEFWFALPGLVKSGVMFIVHGFKKETTYTEV